MPASPQPKIGVTMADGSTKVTTSPTVLDLRRTPSAAARFPIPDKGHARDALARLAHAKNLPPEARQIVAQRAANVLGKVTPGAEKYGVWQLTRSQRDALTQPPVVIHGHKSRLLPHRKVRIV